MKQRFTSTQGSGTQAVTRAVAVLKTLSWSSQGHGITDLAQVLGLSKATVFRLVTALENERMITRDPLSGVCRLGPEVIALGASALRTADLRTAARVELVTMVEQAGETATLEVLVGNDVLILEEVMGHHILGGSPEIGMRWPVHATSTGKVLLAFAKYGLARRTRDNPARLRAFTPKTIKSYAELDRVLVRVRRQGYATSSGELEPDLVSIAAPVRNHHGLVVASISLNGPATRMRTRRVRELIPLVCHAANRVSSRLGATTEMLDSRPASGSNAPTSQAI